MEKSKLNIVDYKIVQFVKGLIKLNLNERVEKLLGLNLQLALEVEIHRVADVLVTRGMETVQIKHFT